jgi:site-specific recombinase XerD
MEKKVTLGRIFHRDQWRIAMWFDYNDSLKHLVKSLPGCAFSVTHKCFYIDDSEENIKLILKTLKDIADVDIRSIVKKEYIPDRQEIKKHFKPAGENPVIENHGNKRFGPVEFRINQNESFLVIKFLGFYDQEWVNELITYSNCYYDKVRKEWQLPWSKITVDSLADFFSSRGVSVKIKKFSVSKELLAERKATGDEIRSKELTDKSANALNALSVYLDDNRYSARTRESYLSALEFFLRYFSPRDPGEITEDEISMFIYDHIIKLGYSASYQNQMVSALKTYYHLSGRGRVKPVLLERPRRSRSLPKVFSKEEVSSILNSARNIKHKALLWMIYSCGLRRSEATNIKVEDLDRKRGIIHIREGKGMVDRVVPVSQKVWDKLEDYIKSYNPRIYLFEGQTGGRYSPESVYRVFKEALFRAGIRKEVGVHSLRHSYATHLHENGLDIRYIQELLGHKSTRTTEIYTHVSRRNLVQVRSPIEDLDVK